MKNGHESRGSSDLVTALDDWLPQWTTAATVIPNGKYYRARSRARLKLAHQRIGELEDDNRGLRDQIARLYGQRRQDKTTPFVADTVHDADNQVNTPLRIVDPR